MAQPIAVHYWPTPNGHKITIALEEMGLAYEIVPVNIGRGDQFKPEFLAISPNNRMPAIVDPDGPDGRPISIFESGAILQHLGRKSGRFYGTDERSRVEIEQWLYWQMANLGPNAGQANHFRNYARAITPDTRHTAYGAHRYTCEIERLFGVLDRRLADRAYMAGDYSIADMATWPWIGVFNVLSLSLDDYPHMQAWYERVRARPAVERALEVGKSVREGAGASDPGRDGDAVRRVLFGQRGR
jgi:GST-like protein